MINDPAGLERLLEGAAAARADWTGDPLHECAFRLFNGFLEGDPNLVVDIYGRTAVVQDYARQPGGPEAAEKAAASLLALLPWIHTVILKVKQSKDPGERNGRVLWGGPADRKVKEHGVWYAVDLMLNLDASLYLDTRGLRRWAIDHMAGKRVLNTFAYTGSLGVAALAGGAADVIQTDRSARFLTLAKESCILNGFPVRKGSYRAGDFWVLMNQLKRSGELFDCVFVDPPFFSVTEAGRVDLLAESARVINKVRPLVGHDGYLVTINNALFAPGDAYYRLLESLCADGYLAIETLIDAPDDFTGFEETRVGAPPVDPAPFNHSTKIAVLRVRRKDERSAGEQGQVGRANEL